MGEYLDRTRKKVLQAIDDLADLKGIRLNGGLQKFRKGPGPKGHKVKLETRQSDHAPRDVKHVFKAGQR